MTSTNCLRIVCWRFHRAFIQWMHENQCKYQPLRPVNQTQGYRFTTMCR